VKLKILYRKQIAFCMLNLLFWVVNNNIWIKLKIIKKEKQTITKGSLYSKSSHNKDNSNELLIAAIIVVFGVITIAITSVIIKWSLVLESPSLAALAWRRGRRGRRKKGKLIYDHACLAWRRWIYSCISITLHSISQWICSAIVESRFRINYARKNERSWR